MNGSICRVILMIAVVSAGLAAQDATPAGPTGAQESSKSSNERPWVAGKTSRMGFPRGGRLVMNLSAGDATVVENPDATEIVITTVTRNAEQLDAIKIEGKIVGSTGAIRVSGPGNNFRFKIELPTAQDLRVRMSAGDLMLSGIEGDTDVELHAGDCTINLANKAEDYGPVDLSVGVGDLTAVPFEASKSGMLRKFKKERKSKYRFHAHVGAGDLTVK